MIPSTSASKDFRGRAALRVVPAFAAALALASCASISITTMASPMTVDGTSTAIHPEIWPKGVSGVVPDSKIDAQVSDLLAKMSVEDKVGQVVQPDINSITPDDVRKYRFGSILNGGNSGPDGNDRALAPAWLKAADAYYAAAMDAPASRPAIPLIWGSDAVHGNSNIIGATIFPHNIGLGAMRDPSLMRQIGAVTAKELRVIGGDWTFAPTIAVVRDDRWGRTYEGYSEDPRIVSDYAAAIIQGIQGNPGDADFLTGAHVLATAKHFLGDGGTDGGVDQGDNLYSEQGLRDIFAPPYESAIGAGVQTVMASYSSWRGQKSHGIHGLLTDVLVDRLGFNGFIVGDWNGYAQIPGCGRDNCPKALLAGVDMYMAPDGWKGLYTSLVAQAKSGEIPMARLDEAVSRILRVKFRAGVMAEGLPSARPYAGQWNLLGAPEHRAVARQAVRESLVLLKNENQILPLSPKLHVLVAGDGADNLPKQSGGWTISWQGDGNSRTDFPNGSTIFEGIRDAVQAAGGTATLSVDGIASAKPDVAIVVFGENPYAEFQGDRANVDFQSGNRRDLKLLQSLKARGIPVVSVFLSGRPLYVTPEINASDAFVAAWLPGSEGAGIADMLFKKADGTVAYDFRGRLSFSWPRMPEQTPLNVGTDPYYPLFAYGDGMDYAHPKNLGALAEGPELLAAVANIDHYIDAGHALQPWQLLLAGDGVTVPVNGAAALQGNSLKVAQSSGAIAASWSGTAPATLAITGPKISLTRNTDGDMALQVKLRVTKPPAGPVSLGVGCGAQCHGAVDVTDALHGANGEVTLAVRLSCFRAAGADMRTIDTPLQLTSKGAFAVSIESVSLTPGVGAPICPKPQA
jgi:beta-glucosidase